jgi:hypothetical protein
MSCPIGSMFRANPTWSFPYSYEANDNRFNENSGFRPGMSFSPICVDAFDVLYREG